MASACVNNIGMSPANILDCSRSCSTYRWLTPRASFSREFHEGDEAPKVAATKPASTSKEEKKPVDLSPPKVSDPEVPGSEVGDFEFRLDYSVTMLPADELFSNGKLVPLQLSMLRPAAFFSSDSPNIRSPYAKKPDRPNEICIADPYLFSPKAPSCSSRWKELLGLKKLYNNTNAKQENGKTVSSVSSRGTNAAKSLKYFLHRSSKPLSSSLDSSLSVPLLKDSDNEFLSISSRLSLSSSSSGHEHDDLPRLSLDSDKLTLNHTSISLSRNPNRRSEQNRVRTVKTRSSASANATTTMVGRNPIRRVPDSSTSTVLGLSADSPRINSSGKIVFHSLERSSSSPSSFNGGPTFKHKGMERSYSANVRVTPVLNVPICSLRGSSKSGVFGFPLFSSQQKRESSASGTNGGTKCQQTNSRNRTDRT